MSLGTDSRATPTPIESTDNEPKGGEVKGGKVIQTMDINTFGSDMIGKDQKLGLSETIYLTLDRECTPALYLYFAIIAILLVITAGIFIIVGLECNWDFVAI